MSVLAVVLLSVFAYLIIGHQIGAQSVHIWRLNKELHCSKNGSGAERGKSLLSFLLFPLCHRRGMLGARNEAGIDGDSRDFPAFDAMTDPRGYLVCVTFLWPLRLLWNVPLIVILGPDELAKALRTYRTERGKKSVEAKKLREAERVKLEAELGIDESGGKMAVESPVQKLGRLLQQQRELDEAVRQAVVAVYRRQEEVEQEIHRLIAASPAASDQPAAVATIAEKAAVAPEPLKIS